MIFFPGLDDLHHARHFERAFISVNRLRRRRSDFLVRDWIMDSGAFTEISTHAGYRADVTEYAAHIDRWRRCGRMLAAVSQDWMCEPVIVQFTGLSVREHQRRTVQRYRALRALTDAELMPVLQGFEPSEYLHCLDDYGDDLAPGMWVGVGSVCKRNASAGAIEDVLSTIKRERSDLRLHGFGLKTTALAAATVNDLLYSADSMAWSYAARRQGRNAHDWREAARFVRRIDSQPQQLSWRLN